MRVLFHTLVLVLIVVTACAAQTSAQQPDEPLFRAGDENQSIYIDRAGKVVLTVPYDATNFSEGLARDQGHKTHPHRADADGWTDFEEARLGTNPNK